MFSDMDLLKDSYYNVLVTRYDDDCVPSESRWFVAVNRFNDWLRSVDLKHSEVTIRDIEDIQFGSSVSPRWFKYGD